MNYQNALTVNPNKDAVEINETNSSPGMLYKHRLLLKSAKCWHKFVVSNSDGLTRNQILKTILDQVHPLDLIPVFFAKDPKTANACFLARNCENAIDKLCKDRLIIDHPFNKKTGTREFNPFKITIMLNYANTNDVRIDVQKNVSVVLTKRFDNLTKTLNLDNFHEDPDLTEFCTLSQPKIMYFVLHIAKTMAPERIILANNGIKLLNPLDVLFGLKLNCIDLSNNQLPSLNDFSSLKHFPLRELKLTGNPLCDCDEDTYVSQIKRFCPGLEILDGVTLAVDKFPMPRKNSFCNFDGLDLVNQFLEYFFTVYDSPDRSHLAGLYHVDAMFSLTCVYLAGQLSSPTAHLKLYSNYSRNLKKFADVSKTTEFLFRGRANIIEAFGIKLPLTVHDPHSFTTDLMYYTDTCAVIMVTGVFREKAVSVLDKERFFGFSRSFALAKTDSKYVITNDQLHVYNGLTCQEKKSFLQPVEHEQVIQKSFMPKPQSKSDYTDMIYTLSYLTELNVEWSERCLKERSFDLKGALELFVELYKGERIPKDAFAENKSGNKSLPLAVFTPTPPNRVVAKEAPVNYAHVQNSAIHSQNIQNYSGVPFQGGPNNFYY